MLMTEKTEGVIFPCRCVPRCVYRSWQQTGAVWASHMSDICLRGRHAQLQLRLWLRHGERKRHGGEKDELGIWKEFQREAEEGKLPRSVCAVCAVCESRVEEDRRQQVLQQRHHDRDPHQYTQHGSGVPWTGDTHTHTQSSLLLIAATDKKPRSLSCYRIVHIQNGFHSLTL